MRTAKSAIGKGGEERAHLQRCINRERRMARDAWTIQAMRTHRTLARYYELRLLAFELY